MLSFLAVVSLKMRRNRRKTLLDKFFIALGIVSHRLVSTFGLEQASGNPLFPFLQFLQI